MRKIYSSEVRCEQLWNLQGTYGRGVLNTCESSLVSKVCTYRHQGYRLDRHDVADEDDGEATGCKLAGKCPDALHELGEVGGDSGDIGSPGGLGQVEEICA